MSAHAILNMSQKRVTTLQSHMLDVCLAYEFGADCKLTAKRAKNASLGATKKALELIEQSDDDAMNRLSMVMTETVL